MSDADPADVAACVAARRVSVLPRVSPAPAGCRRRGGHHGISVLPSTIGKPGL
jgi:hypothetical protein